MACWIREEKQRVVGGDVLPHWISILRFCARLWQACSAPFNISFQSARAELSDGVLRCAELGANRRPTYSSWFNRELFGLVTRHCMQ